MPNTFRQWFKSIRLLLAFYSIFLIIALVSDSGGDLALLGWRISLAISSLMTIAGMLGSWLVISRGIGKQFFPSLEYIGVWSIITVEASHAFYVGPVIDAQGGDPSYTRTLSHFALALGVYLISRRRMRWSYDHR